MAEIEIGILARQCLDRRIADGDALQTEVDAWQQARNAARMDENLAGAGNLTEMACVVEDSNHDVDGSLQSRNARADCLAGSSAIGLYQPAAPAWRHAHPGSESLYKQ